MLGVGVDHVLVQCEVTCGTGEAFQSFLNYDFRRCEGDAVEFCHIGGSLVPNPCVCSMSIPVPPFCQCFSGPGLVGWGGVRKSLSRGTAGSNLVGYLVFFNEGLGFSLELRTRNHRSPQTSFRRLESFSEQVDIRMMFRRFAVLLSEYG
jgi:hypothetical protein